MPVIEVLEENQTDTSTEEFNVATSAGEVGNVQSARRKLSASLVGFIAVAILLMTGFVFWQRQSQAKQQAATDGKQALPSASLAIAKNTRQEIHSPSDEEAVKKVVKDSQLLETLGFYEHPEQFDAELLKKYWLPEESGGKAIAEVHKSIKRLLEKKYHYGSESKNEVFEIRTVRIFSPRDYAEVSTVEQWFVPIYNEDGSREINRNARLGPYTVDYTLHKIEGVWLLEENSTPRSWQYVIPTPTVAAP